MTEIFAPYKWEALFARWPDILAAFGTVSYTHLDVYKRQGEQRGTYLTFRN